MYRFTRLDTLDESVLRAALAGALVACAGSLTPLGAGNLMAWAGPMALAFALSTGTVRARLPALILGLAATAAGLVWAPYRLFGELVTGAVLAAVLVRQAPKSWLKLVSLGLGAIAWPVAMEALRLVGRGSFLHTAVPTPVVFAAVGALAGVLLALVPLPTHLEKDDDPVGRALARLRPVFDEELRSLVLRLVEARARAIAALDHSRAETTVKVETRRSLDGIALTAVELTERYAQVERVLGPGRKDALTKRTEQLQAQLDEAIDEATKSDLQQALTSLQAQQRQVETLGQGRQRLVARLQRELASLEQTELSLALLASGDAALSGLRLGGIGAALSRQAQELEAEGSALQAALAESARTAC